MNLLPYTHAALVKAERAIELQEQGRKVSSWAGPLLPLVFPSGHLRTPSRAPGYSDQDDARTQGRCGNKMGLKEAADLAHDPERKAEVTQLTLHSPW